MKHRSIVNFQNDMEGILRLIDAGAGGGVLMNQGSEENSSKRLETWVRIRFTVAREGGCSLF